MATRPVDALLRRMKKNALLLAFIAILTLFAAAYYLAHEKKARHAQIVALVKDTSDHLRNALNAQIAGNIPPDLERDARVAEANVSGLHNIRTSSLQGLVDAADGVLVADRELVRRMVSIADARRRLAVNVEALAEHIKSDRGARDWTREAVRLKAAVDKDARDYRIAVESYSSQLESLPASQSKLAPYVDRTVLIDDKLLQNARDEALDAYARSEEHIRRVATLQGYRVGATRAH